MVTDRPIPELPENPPPRPLIERGVPAHVTPKMLDECERMARKVMGDAAEVADGAPKIGSLMLVVMPEVHLGLVLRIRELEAGLDEAWSKRRLYFHEREVSRREDELRDALEACFMLWARSSGNHSYGATEAEARASIVKTLGPERTQRALDAAGVASTEPPTASGRHG